MEGVLLLNKPMGVTSHDAVGIVRRLYGTRQVGHTGTLDPMATGLLCVLVGRAVKASEYAVEHDKTYEVGLTLGVTTDTEDTTGTVLTRSSILPDAEKVRKAAESFIGDSFQVPPMYSALKVNGQKLCDLARRGETVERQARQIHINSLVCRPLNEKEGRYRLSVFCSRGTYMRTLCADIGKMLGCGGVMDYLNRTAVGRFSLTDSVSPDSLADMTVPEREALLIPTERLFDTLPIVRLAPFFARLALSGCEIYLHKIGLNYEEGTFVRLYDDSFFSLGEVRRFREGLAVKPIKKFRE